MTSKLSKGRIHVYTGDGKGKTTAALGLALRAAGAGLRVFFIQFAKARVSNEKKALKRFNDRITFRQYGCESFIVKKPTARDLVQATRGFTVLRTALLSGRYDVVIVDEGNIALHYGMIDLGSFLDLLRDRPQHVEVVVTGRKAPSRLVAIADLVTEMRNVRHYFDYGVPARKGIEE